MSDEEEQEKPFVVERAKTGRAKCKKCKCPLEQGSIRVAKLMSNPFGEGKMKAWHHPTCLFEVFAKQRATTKRIDDFDEDVSGWDTLDDEGKDILRKKLDELNESAPLKTPKKRSPVKKNSPIKGTTEEKAVVPAVKKIAPAPIASSSGTNSVGKNKVTTPSISKVSSRDDSFREFRRLCASISNASAYTAKTAIIRDMFLKGSTGDGFEGDIGLWCKMLLPGVTKRVYNLQSKQLVKLFSRLFNKDEDDMLEHLEQGDVAETIQFFFEQSSLIQPASKSLITIREVDQLLEKLSTLTKEEEQTLHFKSIATKCTTNDLKMVIRLIKHDLRITAGAKHVLDAIHHDAYTAFQVSRDLDSVVSRFLTDSKSLSPSKKGLKEPFESKSTGSKISLALMTPVLPMLAEACKSVDMAMKKCPHGMLSEIKYDGERVQVHKEGSEFRYFSRSLKPVMSHKVGHFKEYIVKAFPGGDDLILDAEVLMVDNTTGKPLPFGSLGAHKKAEFKDANVCLFVFDCLYYNGEILLDKTMRERRDILKNKMNVIENRIMLSEVEEVQDPKDLARMIAKVIKLGLEGLVLKDVTGKYAPGKRHWLKVKKDYLLGGAMADTADLVVLGAWYGTGKKGGMMSVFLMGCYDQDRNRWVTVTKVHTGHDDATLERLQGELDMVKISKDINQLPDWLHANKQMVPDFVAKDPKEQPVWEITGAEFTNQGFHTADGISIRFPRVTRVRDDKNWETATSLKELKILFAKSSDSVDVSMLLAGHSSDTESPDGTAKKKRDNSTVGTGGSLINSKQLNEPRVGNEENKETTRKQIKLEECFGTCSKEKELNIETGATSSMIKTEIDEDETDSKKRRNEPMKRKLDEDETKFGKRLKIETVVKVEKDRERRSSNGDGKRDEGKSRRTSSEKRDESRKKRHRVDPSQPSTSAAAAELERNEPLLPTSGQEESLARDKVKMTKIFNGVRLLFSCDVDEETKDILRGILIPLGAEVLETRTQNQATHVVHSRHEIPSDIILEQTDVPRTARHVTEGWLEASLKSNKLPDPEIFAVTLTEAYCRCPCPHRR